MSSLETTLQKSEDKANLALIDRLNQKHMEEFRKIPYEDRILFLPQCMRNADVCKAENTEMGYVCKHCGACSISEIKKTAEEIGYKVFIVPGGRMIYKIVKKFRPKAAVGVACSFELAEAMEKLTEARLTGQGVLLDKDGCRNTCVNKESTIELLYLNGHKVGAYPFLDEEPETAKHQEA